MKLKYNSIKRILKFSIPGLLILSFVLGLIFSKPPYVKLFLNNGYIQGQLFEIENEIRDSVTFDGFMMRANIDGELLDFVRGWGGVDITFEDSERFHLYTKSESPFPFAIHLNKLEEELLLVISQFDFEKNGKKKLEHVSKSFLDDSVDIRRYANSMPLNITYTKQRSESSFQIKYEDWEENYSFDDTTNIQIIGLSFITDDKTYTKQPKIRLPNLNESTMNISLKGLSASSAEGELIIGKEKFEITNKDHLNMLFKKSTLKKDTTWTINEKRYIVSRYPHYLNLVHSSGSIVETPRNIIEVIGRPTSLKLNDEELVKKSFYGVSKEILIIGIISSVIASIISLYFEFSK